MRAAGIFSHLVLAFVCAGLTVVALPQPAIDAVSGPADSPAAANPEPHVPGPSPSAAAPPAIETVTAAPQSLSRPLLEPVTPVDPPAQTAASQAEPGGLQSWAEAARPLEVPAVPPATVAEAAPFAPAHPQPQTVAAALAAADPAPIVSAAPVKIAAAGPLTTSTVMDGPATGKPATAVPPPPAPTDPLADPHVNGGTPGLKPAKALFGAVSTPAPLAARAIGSYARGCLAGAEALPVDGETWQAMRLSRNRNWGHPKLIKLIEKLSSDGKQKDGWSGLLVGDIAQPRGGPMLTGHASHQIGLDADIWLTPMPDRRLSNKERETIEATSMLSEDGTAVNRDVWTEGHLNILKRAASYPEVERIFVHPAIKQVLCYAARDDRAWLSKVRPYWGHHYHFHIRIHCPPGSQDCAPQASVPGDEGCGTELDDWMKRISNVKPDPAPLPIPAPPVVAAKPKEKPPMTLDQLPEACSVVLAQDNPKLQADIAAAAAAAAASVKAAEAAKAAKLAEAAHKLAANPSAKTGLKSASNDDAKAGPHAAGARTLAPPHAPSANALKVEKKSASQ